MAGPAPGRSHPLFGKYARLVAPPTPLQALDLGVYVSAGLSYLFAVTFAAHLTLAGFLALSLAQVAWLAAYGRLHVVATDAPPAWGPVLTLLGSALVAATTLLLGLSFDWLLPVITVGVVAACFPLRRAIALGLGMFAATMALTLWPYPPSSLAWQSAPQLGVAFAFSIVFSYLVGQQISARTQAQNLLAALERSQDELRAANAQLTAAAGQVEELTVTRERNRMAREIHDTLGHFLTILAVKLEMATKLEARGDPRLRAELAAARRLATDCLAEVRVSVAALRPADPTARALDAALRHLAGEFEAAGGVPVTLDCEGDLAALAPDVRLTLFRAAQEALTNIRKHAQAGHVLLRLRTNGEQAELTVLDDGVGAAGAGGQGFGLLGMRERVALLGGSACAGPDHERGWRVTVGIPLAPQPAGTLVGGGR